MFPAAEQPPHAKRIRLVSRFAQNVPLTHDDGIGAQYRPGSLVEDLLQGKGIDDGLRLFPRQPLHEGGGRLARESFFSNRVIGNLVTHAYLLKQFLATRGG